MPSGYTAMQRAAFGFYVLDRADRDQRWRGINLHRLSFSQHGWDVLAQIHGTTVEGMGKLCITPAEAIDLGFVALSGPDAEQLRMAWYLLLNTDDTDPDSPPPPPRKELPS